MFSRQLLTRGAVAVGCAALVGATALGPATAGTTHPAARGHVTYVAFEGGKTTLALNKKTAQVLTDNGVSVTPVSEAKVTQGGIAFPIQGGMVKAKTLAGKITHSGGLNFSAGGKDLTIRDFTVNTKKGTLTAWVEQVGKRLTILDLSLAKAKVHLTKKQVTVKNVRATLDKGAAAALNAYYGVSLFKGGLKIGVATVAGKIKVLAG